MGPGATVFVTAILWRAVVGGFAEEAWRARPDLKVLFTSGCALNAMVHNGAREEGLELIMTCLGLEGLAPMVAKVMGAR